VRAIREAVPQVHLHVLGLSSPEYARQWNQIGVQSFDGSSHFKQAFTGGAFYTCEGAKLIKHQAARPGNIEDLGIVAPECHCRACTVLREVGIDTRSYGSNENNMGRAAHNLNMLMLSQAIAMGRTEAS
jgi:queuine/archaeosine tRNA-ribosyltransferase